MNRIASIAFILAIPLSSGHAAAAALPQHAVAASPPATNTCLIMAISIALLLAAANVACVALAIAFSFRRALATDPAGEWEDPRYRKALPNALAFLSQTGFAQIWPRRCTPWSMHAFESRLARALRPILGKKSRRFAEQHLSTWIWIQSHHSECQRWVRRCRLSRAAKRLFEPIAESERSALLALIHASSLAQNEPLDSHTLQTLRQLQRLNAILQEHGFQIADEFLEVDRLDLAPAENIADALAHPKAIPQMNPPF